MKKKLILLLLLIVGVVNCVADNINLPSLVQPKYFDNDTVEWFPETRGGTPVKLEHMNGVVSIQNRYGYHLCSGTLVSYKHVLTAASCLLNQDGHLLDTSEIRVIADDILIVGDGSVTRQVQEIEKFYLRSTSSIAMIELLNSLTETTTLTYNEVSNQTVSDGDICQVIGWGASASNSEVRLQTINVQIVNNIVANSSKYYNNSMPSGTIAALPQDGESSCFGDLGSVLVCNDIVNGILSLGYGCGRSDFPLVFYDTYDDDLIAGNRVHMKPKPGGSKPSITKPGKYPIYVGGGAGGTSNSNNKNRTCVTNENGEYVCGASTINLSIAILLITTALIMY